MKAKNIFGFIAILLTACNGSNNKSDAYGNFEAIETIVSAEGQGRLLNFNIQEGMEVSKDRLLGIIDTVPLYLKFEQAMAQKESAQSKFAQINAQIAVQEEQKSTLIKEQKRFNKLVADSAAPVKQLDDINGQIRVLDNTIQSIKTQYQGLAADIKGVSFLVAQLRDQINKCKVTSPISGTVLEKYVETGEMVVPGKSLYKMADMSILQLRVYISGDQLPHLKLGQEVTVLIDETKTTNKPIKGKVSWISSQAEFTPKIIQTKDERVNLVYAVKIDVPNDGSIKIGMPGEMRMK
jgi:HlyD family secretion protein